MSMLMRGGLASLVLLLACGLCAPVAFAQDEERPAEGAFEPDPNEPITVDFVRKDIHTVMHYIALRSGLQIIVQGEVSVQLTVMFRRVLPKEAIQSICKANKLDYIEDGAVIIIKQRPQDTGLANVVKGENLGRFHVNFETHALVEAIMEVARVTGIQVFVPSVPPAEGQQPRDPEEEGQGEQRVQDIQARAISMHMREAVPEQILYRLADLGDLDVKKIDRLDDSVEGSEVGYRFTYKPVRRVGGPIGPDPGMGSDDVVMVSESWVIPGANTSNIKSNLSDLLSPYGKIVHDDVTDYVMVYEEEKRMELVRGFMNALVQRTDDMEAERLARVDDLVVREYRLVRDTSPSEFLSSIANLVSDDGRVIANPDRNSIVVYERASRIAAIDKIMAAMDTAPEQVLITAKLIEVTIDEYIGYGLEIFTNHSANNLNDGRFTGGSFDTTQGAVGGLFGQPTGFDPFFATFTNPRVDVRLELLANEGRVKTLSQPTQMVSNRQTANIVVGQEIPYLEASTQSGAGAATASVAFKEVSIRMDITPTVLESGLVRLEVSVRVAEVIGNIAIEGNNTPVLSTRESTTDVFIRDGETLIMGGLMRERDRYDENGLPFLKDIPFLGYLFKSANQTTSKTDLLFFLRPQIVNANGPRLEMANMDIERDLRPVIYEDGDERAAEIRGNRFRKIGTSAKPAWYNEQTRPKTAKDVKPGA
jgi:type II secretory pathway component GspD/PulD (secretin)